MGGTMLNVVSVYSYRCDAHSGSCAVNGFLEAVESAQTLSAEFGHNKAYLPCPTHGNCSSRGGDDSRGKVLKRCSIISITASPNRDAESAHHHWMFGTATLSLHIANCTFFISAIWLAQRSIIGTLDNDIRSSYSIMAVQEQPLASERCGHSNRTDKQRSMGQEKVRVLS